MAICARGAATSLTRLHIAFHHPAAHAPGDVAGHLAQAMEQHVAVAQQNTMVMVVWRVDLPEYLAVPVSLEDHAGLEWKAAEEVLIGSSPVEEQRSALGEISRHACLKSLFEKETIMDREQAKLMLTLADFLENLPPKKLIMGSWMRPQESNIPVNRDAAFDKGQTFKFEGETMTDLTPRRYKTAGCAMGWAPTLPEFQKLGLHIRCKSQPNEVQHQQRSRCGGLFSLVGQTFLAVIHIGNHRET
jgi:hypothetical protein